MKQINVCKIERYLCHVKWKIKPRQFPKELQKVVKDSNRTRVKTRRCSSQICFHARSERTWKIAGVFFLINKWKGLLTELPNLSLIQPRTTRSVILLPYFPQVNFHSKTESPTDSIYTPAWKLWGFFQQGTIDTQTYLSSKQLCQILKKGTRITWANNC